MLLKYMLKIFMRLFKGVKCEKIEEQGKQKEYQKRLTNKRAESLSIQI